MNTHSCIRSVCHATGLVPNERREIRNLLSICDCSTPTESSARSARQARAVIHRRDHYYRYLNPVVIMDRHPADEPSVLQVEIDGAPAPLSALCNVFKRSNRGERRRERKR